jgi:FkbM family methyltransferase
VERRRLEKLDGTIAQELKTGHIDSLELLELLRDKPPDVIYDIGANIGTWTLLAKAIFPAAEIHAFEPLDRLKGEFLRRTSGVTDLYLHPIALGSSAAAMPLKVTNFVDASSLLNLAETHAKLYGLRPVGEESVQVERLDDYVQRLALRPPNLLKFDIQGYELEALRGAEKCLQTADAVLSEVSFVELYNEQCLFHDVTRFLADRGFLVFAFGAQTALGYPLLQTDVLFVREDIRNQLGV